MIDTRRVQACLDVETTGLTPGWHEIIELALVPRRSDFQPLHIRIQAEWADRYDDGAYALHELDPALGLTKREAWNAVSEWSRSYCLDTGLSKVRLIGQQVGTFDCVFATSTWGVKSWNQLFSYRYRDTAVVAMALMDAGVITPESAKLNHLLEYFGIPLPQPAHRALPDATAELELWLKLEEVLKQHPGAMT